MTTEPVVYQDICFAIADKPRDPIVLNLVFGKLGPRVIQGHWKWYGWVRRCIGPGSCWCSIQSSSVSWTFYAT